jgi:hypothetical protein
MAVYDRSSTILTTSHEPTTSLCPLTPWYRGMRQSVRSASVFVIPRPPCPWNTEHRNVPILFLVVRQSTCTHNIAVSRLRVVWQRAETIVPIGEPPLLTQSREYFRKWSFLPLPSFLFNLYFQSVYIPVIPWYHMISYLSRNRFWRDRRLFHLDVELRLLNCQYLYNELSKVVDWTLLSSIGPFPGCRRMPRTKLKLCIRGRKILLFWKRTARTNLRRSVDYNYTNSALLSPYTTYTTLYYHKIVISKKSWQGESMY